jgi:adenylate cyclase
MTALLEAPEPASAVAPAVPLICDPILLWLLTEGRFLRDSEALADGLARRIVAEGIPITRMTTHAFTLHPRLLAMNVIWRPEHGARPAVREHGIENSPAYLKSPIRLVYERQETVRRRLTGPDARIDFPILEELQGEGATDYLITPLPFSVSRQAAVGWTTDRPSGFAEGEVARLLGLVPALSIVMEAMTAWSIARNLVDTYIGRRSGGRVLQGHIKRGDVETIRAVLWYCDLRASTRLSERLTQQELVDTLNQYFGAMGEAVEEGGGEILKFIGDAMLAIFPIEDRSLVRMTCTRALDAAESAVRALDRINIDRAAAEQPILRCGIALHRGEVGTGTSVRATGSTSR